MPTTEGQSRRAKLPLPPPQLPHSVPQCGLLRVNTRLEPFFRYPIHSQNDKSQLMAKPNDLQLKQVVEVLKKKFKPKRMFLFGSRASGSARPDSDYDIVLVVPKLRSRHLAEVQARSLVLNICGVSADIFIYDQADFDDWKDELSSIPETALNTGREIDLG